MITIFKEEVYPRLQTKVIKKIPSLQPEVAESYLGVYFVGGCTNTGARYYSENTTNFDYAIELFSLYKDIVEYFGGGIVQLYCITPNGCDVIKISKVN